MTDVVLDAIQFNGVNHDEVFAWLGTWRWSSGAVIAVDTPQGTRLLQQDLWAVRVGPNQLYVLTDDQMREFASGPYLPAPVSASPARLSNSLAVNGRVAATVTVVLDDLVLSDPPTANLQIYRGDTGQFRVTVTNADLSPKDVSGATWKCMVRATEDAATVMATFQVTPVAGDTSSVDVILTSTESDKLVAAGVWDLQMTLASAVSTLLAGKVVVRKDVSR